MFVSRKSHEALVAAKDQQIAVLHDEVQWLRRMIQPSYSLSPKVNMEADLALEGRQEQLPETSEEQAAIDSEAARILSGQY